MHGSKICPIPTLHADNIMFEYSTILYSAFDDSHMGFYVGLLVVAFSYAMYYDNCVRQTPTERQKFQSRFILALLGIFATYVGYQSYSNDISVECADKQETVVAYLSTTMTEAVVNENVFPRVFGQYMYMDDAILVEKRGAELPERQNFYRIDVKKYPQCSKK